MLMHTWTSGYGVLTQSPILARFTDHGKRYVVVAVGRSRYDPNPPYAVLEA